MKELGADGMNGDTMNGVTEDFKNAYVNAGYPLALQPEVNMSDLKMVEWNRMSWGYYWKDWDSFDLGYSPGVSLYKWLEPRHQVHITDRWAVDKTSDLQFAFFNGIGYNAWENIWGIWNQVPERYAEAIRKIRFIYQSFPDVWYSAGWEPHVPVLQSGVFASKFSGSNETVYTFVNRDSISKTGNQIQLPYQKDISYYDIWNATKLTPHTNGDTALINFPIEGNGFGALLVTSKSSPAVLLSFLIKMKQISKPLNSLSRRLETFATAHYSNSINQKKYIA